MSEAYDDRHSNTTRYIKQHVTDTVPILDSDDDGSQKSSFMKPAFWTSLMAGGIAGVVVDFVLYPLDTIKTRLQSQGGFRASGGFRKMYKGMLPVLICSAPVSAVFFCVYNEVINLLRSEKTIYDPLVYIVAASAGEVLCSTVRVPLEIVKQRKQTTNFNSVVILKRAMQKEGFLGLYRGFSSTIAREVPFACIQFPLWEYLLQELIIYQNGEPLTALQTAYCGAVAGATAGALTTPVDVLKTRIMLAEKEKIHEYSPQVYRNFIKEVYRERGLIGFFSGLIPRTLWIMFGGFIYFGTYEEVKLIKEQKWCFIKRKIEALRESASNYADERIWKALERLYCTEEVQKPVMDMGKNEDETVRKVSSESNVSVSAEQENATSPAKSDTPVDESSTQSLDLLEELDHTGPTQPPNYTQTSQSNDS